MNTLSLGKLFACFGSLLLICLYTRRINTGKYMLLAVSVFLISTTAYAEAVWRLRKNEDGIKVFTSCTETSDFKAVKVECTVRATPSQLVALLMDIDKDHEWVYASKSSEILKVLKPNDFIFYSQVSVPWPFVDRDYIAHMSVKQPSPDLVVIDASSEPDLLPVRDGIVRVRKHGAHWEVTNLGNQQIRVVYTVNFDPSGSIPPWLTNLFVVKGPFETFQVLKNRVLLPKYRNAHFDFLQA